MYTHTFLQLNIYIYIYKWQINRYISTSLFRELLGSLIRRYKRIFLMTLFKCYWNRCIMGVANTKGHLYGGLIIRELKSFVWWVDN